MGGLTDYLKMVLMLSRIASVWWFWQSYGSLMLFFLFFKGCLNYFPYIADAIRMQCYIIDWRLTFLSAFNFLNCWMIFSSVMALEVKNAFFFKKSNFVTKMEKLRRPCSYGHFSCFQINTVYIIKVFIALKVIIKFLFTNFTKEKKRLNLTEKW